MIRPYSWKHHMEKSNLLLFCWLAFIVPESGEMVEKNRHQSYPAMNPESYNNNRCGKGCNSDSDVMETTSSSLIGCKSHRRKLVSSTVNLTETDPHHSFLLIPCDMPCFPQPWTSLYPWQNGLKPWVKNKHFGSGIRSVIKFYQACDKPWIQSPVLKKEYDHKISLYNHRSFLPGIEPQMPKELTNVVMNPTP